MKNPKFTIPLDLIDTIDGIALKNRDLIRVQYDDQSYYHFRTNLDNENYRFVIYRPGKGNVQGLKSDEYAFEWSPSNTSKVEGSRAHGKIQTVVDHFNHWLKLLKRYSDSKSILDDPFTEKYNEYYTQQFDTADEDAEYAPFDPAQQEILETHLGALSEAIATTLHITDEELRKSLVNETREIILSLPCSTKKQVIKRMAGVMTQLFKHCKGFAKEILQEAKKHLIKELIKAGVKYGGEVVVAIGEAMK